MARSRGAARYGRSARDPLCCQASAAFTAMRPSRPLAGSPERPPPVIVTVVSATATAGEVRAESLCQQVPKSTRKRNDRTARVRDGATEEAAGLCPRVSPVRAVARVLLARRQRLAPPPRPAPGPGRPPPPPRPPRPP